MKLEFFWNKFALLLIPPFNHQTPFLFPSILPSILPFFPSIFPLFPSIFASSSLLLFASSFLPLLSFPSTFSFPVVCPCSLVPFHSQSGFSFHSHLGSSYLQQAEDAKEIYLLQLQKKMCS